MKNESQQHADDLPAHLEGYLLLWGEWATSYYAGPARVHASGLIQTGEKHSTKAIAQLETSDIWAAKIVDACVESLKDPMHKLVLHVQYANKVGPAVWQNNRLPKDESSFDALLNAAKWALVPILRRKDLPI